MIPFFRWDDADAREALKQRSYQLAALTAGAGPEAEVASEVLQRVRAGGDAALVASMQEFTNPAFCQDDLRVPAGRITAAVEALDAPLRGALERAIHNVRAYQEHVRPRPVQDLQVGDALLGMRHTAVASSGLMVPGGKAAYPSSVIMLAVPAQVAGVPRICVVSPPPTDLSGTGPCSTSPLVLAACGLLGLDEVYAVGGAQGVGALAYGTHTIAPVDFVAGPGNAFVTHAKRQVFGTVGIDGLYGPSEIVVVADHTAEPTWVAADMIAQAEHDPGSCILVCTDRSVLERVMATLAAALRRRARRQAIEDALGRWSATVLAADLETACEITEFLAPEHVCLAVAEPAAAMGRIRHGGAFFLGGAPVASGDYYAGPSHCLPTGRTARFSSGVSVYTFLKRSSVEAYPEGMDAATIADIDRLAQAEGLDGHAESVRLRGD